LRAGGGLVGRAQQSAAAGMQERCGGHVRLMPMPVGGGCRRVAALSGAAVAGVAAA